jgi:hypothetical protein
MRASSPKKFLPRNGRGDRRELALDGPLRTQRRAREFRGEGRAACRPRALRIAERRSNRNRISALLNKVLKCDPEKLLRLAPSTRSRLLAHAYAQAGYERRR